MEKECIVKEQGHPESTDRQVIRPQLAVEVPKYSKELIEAMTEAERISRDPNVPGYTNMADIRKALEA